MFNQSEFNLRCEWGMQGVTKLAPISDIVVIVDILSFSTSVEIATNKGAIVFPYQWRDESALEYAKSVKAQLANRERQSDNGYSLAPASLINIPAGIKLVLPSPNGSSLSLLTGSTPTLAGCLRNAQAIAQYAQRYSNIAVIPAGERWEDGSLRPAIEDLIGAGAILSELKGKRSPEAEAAVAVFQQCNLAILTKCSSGKELSTRGFAADVELATASNISRCVPLLVDRAYVNQTAIA